MAEEEKTQTDLITPQESIDEHVNYMEKVNVKMGDIINEEADAIITLINPQKAWFGGVDYAIMSAADEMYHQVPAAMELHDGQVIIAEGDHQKHHGMFNNVIFVVDDRKRPLNELVFTALQEAHNSKFKSVSLPVMRTGVMLGAVEPDKISTIKEMVIGIKNFHKKYSAQLEINIVVFNDEEAFLLLNKMLS